MEADVVIVGYGGAGACAAIEAADLGNSVIVLEKNPEDNHFSNTLMSGGIFHSPDPDGDPEALKSYLRAMFSGDNLPTKSEGEQSPEFVDGIVDRFAEMVVENKDFLTSLDPDYNPIERGGAAFPQFPGAEESGYKSYNSSYGNSATGPKFPTLDMDKYDTAAGFAVFNCMRTGVEDREDMITIAWETPGQSLIKNDAGGVIGVVATQGGAEVRVKAAKGVILTTGGYEYSLEMRRAFLEGPGITGWAFYGTTSNTGDGIRMGAEAGAQLAKVGKAASRLIFACPDVKVGDMEVGSITDSVGSAGTIVVDSYGKRFMNEGLISTDPSRYFSYKNAVHMDIETLEFPNLPSYMIFDETRRLESSLVNLTLSTCGFGFIEWDEENQIPVDKGWILKGETFEELAEKIRDTHELNKGRMDPETFAATLANYNDVIVATGVDEEFGRTSAKKDPITGEVVDAGFQPIADGPFYAMPLVAGGPNTKGGLQTDGERRVVGWDNQPIPRLYSAGEMSSTFMWVYQGGGIITECITCGRIAAQSVSAETPWE
ncbi:MAG: FAD-binding protein [Eggerthellaceae bacterium]|nr:FAD-binding protein [Eggerthellaceae bacterium]